MTSFVWERSPEEAYANPYEHGAQDQFVREAGKLLDILYKYLDRYVMKFHRDDTSLKKTTWMLQVDALDSLSDCLDMLKTKKHRLAGRLFRDVIETLDIAAYFNSGSKESLKDLKQWYQDEIISHRKYRLFIKKFFGEEAQDLKREVYQQLSKFTHRTYKILRRSYSLGTGDMLVYDSTAESGILVLPHTISEYFAILAWLIKIFVKELIAHGLATQEEVNEAWDKALEEETVPRRFAPHPPLK